MRLWILLIVLAFVAGCDASDMQETDEPEKQELSKQADEQAGEPEKSADEETISPEAGEQTISQANQFPNKPEHQYEPVEEVYSVKKFYEIYNTEVNNYQFKFNTDIYKVKGNLVKIELGNVRENLYNAPFVDTIYLDRERKTAIGVCEGRNNNNLKKKCIVREVLKRQFAMPYIAFAIKFPDDWLTEFLHIHTFPADRPLLATERPNIHLKHTSASRKTELFFDPTSGLPMVVSDNSIEYHYKSLAKNTVNEKFLVEK